MLIAMTGQKRSGKDTVAALIHDYEYGRRTFERVSFAGTLKGMIRHLLLSAGMNEETAEDHINGNRKEVPLDVLQGKTTRFAMQTLGTEWRDLIGKDLWTDIVRAKVGSTPDVMLTDMRFLHEERFVGEMDGKKIRVVRAGQAPISKDAHPSEQEMNAITPDATIFNHGSMEDLRVAAILAYEHLAGRIPLMNAEDYWNGNQA
mgnify:CR=1 FL=1